MHSVPNAIIDDVSDRRADWIVPIAAHHVLVLSQNNVRGKKAREDENKTALDPKGIGIHFSPFLARGNDVWRLRLHQCNEGGTVLSLKFA